MRLRLEDNDMLTRLLPEQVAKFWDIIKYAVEQSLPPIAGDHPDKMNRILSSILSSKTECWASYRKENDTTIFEGIAVTKIIYDEASDTRNLLLYCVYGYESVDKESWDEAFITLVKYAKSRNCNDVIAYSDIPEIIKRAKAVGGEAKYTFITWNVSELIKKFNALEQS
jgi:hypothetical protein